MDENHRFNVLETQIAALHSLVAAKFQLILDNQATEKNAMSALSDAVAKVQADVAKNQTDVQAVLAILQQPNPDVQAAIDGLTAVDASMTQTNQSLEAATGTPAPTTTPPPASQSRFRG